MPDKNTNELADLLSRLYLLSFKNMEKKEEEQPQVYDIGASAKLLNDALKQFSQVNISKKQEVADFLLNQYKSAFSPLVDVLGLYGAKQQTVQPPITDYYTLANIALQNPDFANYLNQIQRGGQLAGGITNLIQNLFSSIYRAPVMEQAGAPERQAAQEEAQKLLESAVQSLAQYGQKAYEQELEGMKQLSDIWKMYEQQRPDYLRLFTTMATQPTQTGYGYGYGSPNLVVSAANNLRQSLQSISTGINNYIKLKQGQASDEDKRSIYAYFASLTGRNIGDFEGEDLTDTMKSALMAQIQQVKSTNMLFANSIPYWNIVYNEIENTANELLRQLEGGKTTAQQPTSSIAPQKSAGEALEELQPKVPQQAQPQTKATKPVGMSREEFERVVVSGVRTSLGEIIPKDVIMPYVDKLAPLFINQTPTINEVVQYVKTNFKMNNKIEKAIQEVQDIYGGGDSRGFAVNLISKFIASGFKLNEK